MQLTAILGASALPYTIYHLPSPICHPEWTIPAAFDQVHIFCGRNRVVRSQKQAN